MALKMFLKVSVIACGIAGAAAAQASIAINFTGLGPQLAASDTAGVVPQMNWNNVVDSTGTLGPGAVRDDTGSVVSPISASWSAGNTWWTSDPTPTPDTKMMITSLTDYTGPGTPGTITVSITGLTAAYTNGGYSVIVYSEQPDNPEDQVTKFAIQAGNTQAAVWGRDPAGVDYSNLGYAKATGTFDAGMSTPQANYARFDGLTAANFTVTVSTGARTSNNIGGYLRSPVTGIQVIGSAPEPASLLLLALGASGLLVRRRRL